MTKNLMYQATKMGSILDTAKHGKKAKRARSLSEMYMKYGKKPKMKSLAQMGRAISHKKFKSIWM
jgi:hypothetical protein